MLPIKQLLLRKGTEIYSISPEDSVHEALKLLADKDVGALLVLQEGELVGILSERDYTRKVALRGRTSMDTPVKEIMTPEVFTISTDQTIVDIMALMTEKRIRHLPVMDKGKLAGVISIGDVVKAIIEQQEFVIEQLESYISGR